MAGRIKGIEQARAGKAYDYVKEVVDADADWYEFIIKYNIKYNKKNSIEEELKNLKKEHKNLKKKYKTGAKKLPILIKTNGLGQSLAFIYNRDNGWKVIYRQLTEWLQENNFIYKDNEKDKKDDWFLSKVINMKSNDYRQLTIECLSFLNWLRRFVDGLMEDIKEEH